MSDEQFQEWTACQMYGHNFTTDSSQPEYHYCLDCDEAYHD